MYKKYNYSSLSVYEASLIAGLEQGKTLFEIAKQLDITYRSAQCTLQKLLTLYHCETVERLLSNFHTVVTVTLIK
ncbi:MAG: hypothetical protein A3F10_05085 [Coxiella sp. RIFCSPHIGHO2_12_FULL_42_15]|nr:MAG: hypothetical protein A3F10_05085 [Coxiella sp. RIFCSPHIGHO2_12_FULL_42_15]